MKFFSPNLKISKNVASVKCKRVETAKKYGPEHQISLKTGLKQPKMTKIDQNASKLENLVYFFTK